MTHPRSTALLAGLLLPAVPGCAPTIDVLGVYFPGWLVSGILAVVAAYVLVLALGQAEGDKIVQGTRIDQPEDGGGTVREGVLCIKPRKGIFQA